MTKLSTADVAGEYHQHHNNASEKKKRNSRIAKAKARQDKALGDWYRKKCGVDLRDIDKEVTMGLDLSSSSDGDVARGGGGGGGGSGSGNGGGNNSSSGGRGSSIGRGVTSKIFKEDEDTEMSEMHTTTTVTELPIYKRILEEDARAERILRHRKKNSALLDIYTGMFSSVEW